MKSALVRNMIALLSVFTAGQAMAQPQTGEPLRDKLAFEQKLGAKLPLDVEFTDDHGKKIRLGELFGEKPVLLMPVFYTCKSSCLLVRDGVIKTLNAQKALVADRDFDVVAIGLHPKETPELAAAKKAEWLGDYRYKESANGFHLLVGTEENVRRVTDAIGFKYYYDSATDTVAHPAGIVLCTRDGRASEYLLGVSYPQKYVYDGLVRANRNEIGIKTEQILFGCLVYDPASGKYRVVVEKILQVLGTTFAIGVAIAIYFLARNNRRAPLTRDDFLKIDPKPNG